MRDQLEPLFGHTFEDVRIHADEAAAESASEMQASAYTVGQDVFFARHQYDPDTPYGFHLLAHELAHTVQQRGATGPATELVHDDAPGERDARNAADAALAGDLVSIPAGQSSAAVVAREAEAAQLTEAQKAAQIVGQFPWMAHLFPGWATTVGGDGLKAVKTDGTTTLTRGVDISTSGGSISSRRHVETDKDHSMTTDRKVGYADGAAFVETTSGGKSLAEDGTKVADETKRKISAGADSLGYESSKSATRDTVTTTSSKGASYKDGKAELSYERGRDFKLDDDHQMGSKTGVKVGSEGGSLTTSNTSRIKNVETGGVDSTSTKKGVGYDKDKGLNASYSNEKTTEVDGKKFTTGNSFNASKDSVGFNRSSSTTTTGADGKETTSSKSTGVNVGKDGLKLSRETTDAKGNKTSMNAGGDMTFDKNGNPTKIKADVGVSRNGKSVSFSGGYEVSATDPKLVDGAYVVNWERKFSMGGKGKAKGVGASGSHEDSEFGSKTFKTEAEAKAFKENAASKLPSRAHDPTTVEGAMYLDVGESRGKGDKTSGGISAEASFSGGGGISAGMEKSSSSGQNVRRVSPTVFELTISESSRSGENAGVNNFAVGMKGHQGRDTTTTSTVSVDISTPEGKTAFDLFMKTGAIGPGAKLISTSTVKGEDSGKTVDVLGVVQHDRTGRTEEELRYDKDGKLERYSGSATETIDQKMWWDKKGTHNNHSVRLDAYERNDKDSYYSITGTVDAEDPAQSMRRLAEITSSAEGDGQVAGKSSGKWGIEVDITPDMVKQFLEMETDATGRQAGLFDQTARNGLRLALDSAGNDTDAQKKALATYFAEDGYNGKAIKAMRHALHGTKNEWNFGMTYFDRVNNKGGNFDYDLTLEGDKNFQGAGARRELEGKIDSFQKAVKENPAAAGTMHGGIREALKEVQRQRGEIADTKRYTDMPQELRERQVARLDGYISKLQSLAEQSGSAFLEHDAAEFDAKAAEEAKGKKGKKKTAAEPDPATISGMRVEMGRADKIIKEKKAAFQENVELVKYKSLHFRRASGMSEDEFKAGWNEYKGLDQSAQTYRQTAERLEPSANEMRSQFIESLDDPEKAQTVGTSAHSHLNSLRDNWSQAAAKMDAAWSALSRVTE